MNAIKAWIITESTKNELEEAEANVERLTSQINVEPKQLDKVADFIPKAVDRYKKMVKEIEKVTQNDVPRARTQIKKLVGGEIKLYPSESGTTSRPR